MINFKFTNLFSSINREQFANEFISNFSKLNWVRNEDGVVMKNLLTLTLAIICCFGLCQGQSEEEFLKPVNPQDDISQEARIFYGQLAVSRQFPHMCSLLNRKTTGTYTLCGGSLISQVYIYLFH